MNQIYLDYAATTPVRPEVIEAMMPYLQESWGNPSSAHRVGRNARAGLEQAKRETAEALGVEPNQVIFTSGGTEADNLAIIGAALAAQAAGRSMHVVTSAIEHKAALAAAHAVVRLGGRETVLPVDSRCLIDLDALDRALADDPAVVSIMWVNNEIGVVQPVAEIASRCCAAGVPLHTDGVQAFGKIPIDLSAVDCQLLTISGHKIGAPKGIGALIVRDPKIVEAILHGGGQQFGIRPGTENVAGAVALGRAAKLAAAELEGHVGQMLTLRDRLATQLIDSVEGIHVHGLDAPRAPHVLSLCISGTEAGALLMHLDMAGICASGGSACNTGAITPSHVLSAMGIDEQSAVATLRISLGHETTEEEIDHVVAVFPEIVSRVRKLGVALGRA
jgi:cysteine desulfurase